MGLFDKLKKEKSNNDKIKKENVDNSKSQENMQTIIIKLDSRKLENPDLDMIYLIPEKIESITNKKIMDNGYDYLSNWEIAIFLETKSIDNVKEIIDLFKQEKICNCDLSKSAEIYVSENENAPIEQCQKIYPNEEDK